MMRLSTELGVEELRTACEEHITATLGVESACTLLAAAMDAHERPGK